MEDKIFQEIKIEKSNIYMHGNENISEKDLKTVDKQRKIEEQTVNLNSEQIPEEQNDFEKNYEVMVEHLYFLNCIDNLLHNRNTEFDSFLNPNLIKLILKFLDLSKKMATILKMKTINFIDKKSYKLLIHPSQLKYRLLLENFSEKVQQMYEKGQLSQIDERFLEFYNWAEDARYQMYKKYGEFREPNIPPTHQLTERLRYIMISNELLGIPQKKQRVEDDTDLFRSLEEALDSGTEIMKQIDSISSFGRFTSEELSNLFQYAVKLCEKENNFNELIEKSSQTNKKLANKYKNISQYMFSQTYTTYEIISYIKQYNNKYSLNIDPKDFEYLKSNFEKQSEAFFDKWRSVLKEFRLKITTQNN